MKNNENEEKLCDNKNIIFFIGLLIFVAIAIYYVYFCTNNNSIKTDLLNIHIISPNNNAIISPNNNAIISPNNNTIISQEIIKFNHDLC
jgi:hypothetical protein